jgi:diphosphomevalonate decarboxylase
MSLYKTFYPDVSEEAFYRQAAIFARLGSGSATRSVMGSHVVWGSHPKISDSNDEYGIAVDHKVHEVFKTYHDTILLVDKGQKKVSSSLGHSLMEGHPFAERRFMQAQDNMAQLMPILKNGDVERFIQIMESEALSLHAMMMTANPYFILMHPNTLAIIHKIWDFRAETKIPVGFTLDAGANVHVLYPHAHHEKVNSFIINDLAPLCENNQYICDRVGNGASRVVD